MLNAGFSSCFVILIAFFALGCEFNGKKSEYLSADSEFGQYWYQGKAEITAYELSQARYGQLRSGTAMLIFVTEDFSKEKQVKLDHPASQPFDAVKVLKMNRTAKFTTGIYPYSMMLSVFTPVVWKKNESSLKLTASSQEWCGHTFTQLNFKGTGFHAMLRSYFESEGDKDFSLSKNLLEDEIWTRIRLDPASLPKGKLKIIPGLLSQRLRHSPLKEMEATATLDTLAILPEWLKNDSTGVSVYAVNYPQTQRQLKIYFASDFPYQIIAWEESYPDGPQGEILVSRATKKKSIMLDYWNHNRLADTVLRESLGL